MNTDSQKEQAPGQNKEFTFYVNSRVKTFVGKEISYEQIVALAFGNVPSNENVIYSVVYSKGEDKKPKGSLTSGDTVHLKDGMVFDVSPTTKS